VKAQHSLISIAAAMVAATLGTDAPGAEEASAVLSPQALQEILQADAIVRSSVRYHYRSSDRRSEPLPMVSAVSARIVPCRLRRPFHASLPKTKFAADSALEERRFELSVPLAVKTLLGRAFRRPLAVRQQT
jgi:hypothetical protein